METLKRADHFASNSSQITTSSIETLRLSTGRIPFLSPSQQCEGAGGKQETSKQSSGNVAVNVDIGGNKFDAKA